MKKPNLYNAYLSDDSQNDIRNRLIEMLRKHPISITTLARSLQMAPSLLVDFVREDGQLRWVQLCKVEDWVKDKESDEIL